MKKSHIVIITLLVVIILVLLWQSKKSDIVVINPNEDALNEPLEDFNTQETSQVPIFNGEEEQQITEETKYISIDVKYPKFSNPDISRTIKDYVIDEIANFKIENNVDNLNEQNKDPYLQNAKYENKITYKTYQTKELGSVLLTVYINSGGAHGNVFVKNLNFDKAGQLLSIGDLFQVESDYLSRLSSISREKLQNNLGENLASWSSDGTAPTSENFSVFYMQDTNTLNIIFQPYQVAPWSGGIPEISIDINKELGDIIKPIFLE